MTLPVTIHNSRATVELTTTDPVAAGPFVVVCGPRAASLPTLPSSLYGISSFETSQGPPLWATEPYLARAAAPRL